MFPPSVMQLFHPLRILRCSFKAVSTTRAALSVRAVDLFLSFRCVTYVNAQMQKGKSLVYSHLNLKTELCWLIGQKADLSKTFLRRQLFEVGNID